MSLVPPTFCALGKCFHDLVTDTFDAKSGVTVISKTTFGLTLIAAGQFDRTSNWLSTKGVYTDTFGTAEVEVDSQKGKVWSKLCLPKLAKPVHLSFSGGFDPDHKDKLAASGLAAKACVKYSRDYFTGGASVIVAEPPGGLAANISVAGVTSFQGAALGGEAEFHADKATQDLVDYGVRAQYQYNKFLGAFRSEKKGTILSFSLLYTHSPKLTAGLELSADANNSARPQTVTLAAREKCDEKTIFKAKVNNHGEISTALEQRLTHVTAKATTSWSVHENRLKPTSFALALLFGDR